MEWISVDEKLPNVGDKCWYFFDIVGNLTVQTGLIVSGTGKIQNVETSGTISGATITGGVKILSPLITGATVVGTTKVSGTTVTGTTAQFTNATAVNVTGTTLVSGAALSGIVINVGTITGISGTYTQILSGAIITGAVGRYTTLTGVTGMFTSLTGTAIHGTNATVTNITGTIIATHKGTNSLRPKNSVNGITACPTISKVSHAGPSSALIWLKFS